MSLRLSSHFAVTILFWPSDSRYCVSTYLHHTYLLSQRKKQVSCIIRHVVVIPLRLKPPRFSAFSFSSWGSQKIVHRTTYRIKLGWSWVNENVAETQVTFCWGGTISSDIWYLSYHESMLNKYYCTYYNLNLHMILTCTWINMVLCLEV